MRIITGAFAFFDEERRDGLETAPPPFAAEPAAGVLADQHDLRGIDADPARARAARLRDALRRQWMNSLPFCQYAIALRVSIG
jgi:hypothetical protein